jgi:hypothetical protein
MHIAPVEDIIVENGGLCKGVFAFVRIFLRCVDNPAGPAHKKMIEYHPLPVQGYCIYFEGKKSIIRK